MKFTLDIDEQLINEAVIKTMTNEMIEQIEREMFYCADGKRKEDA